MEFLEKLAKRMKEMRDSRAQSHPDESAEERRQRILRRKMRVRPKPKVAEEHRGEKAGMPD